MTRSCGARPLNASSSCAAPTTKSTSRKAATSGGTANWNTSTPIVPPRNSTASIRSSFSTPAAARANPRAFLHTTAGYLLGAYLTTKYVFDLKESDTYWCTADIGWVTGHSYVDLRRALQRRDHPHLRRRAELARARPLLAHHRQVQGHHFLHRADRHPRVHALGRSMAEQTRSQFAAAARHRRRTDQSRSVDVVSQCHRQQSLPDRRHLVADRDRLRS